MRKYARSVGEDPSFDRDGTLRDHRVTRQQAEQIAAMLQERVPELGPGRITVELSHEVTNRRNGKANSQTRKITLVVGRGDNAKTLIHELAHIAAPSVWDFRYG